MEYIQSLLQRFSILLLELCAFTCDDKHHVDEFAVRVGVLLYGGREPAAVQQHVPIVTQLDPLAGVCVLGLPQFHGHPGDDVDLSCTGDGQGVSYLYRAPRIYHDILTHTS